MIKKQLCFLLAVFAHVLWADAPEPEPIENFALPTAMQPSPLFSFGQNTVDAHDAIWYVNPYYLRGKKDKKFFTNWIYFVYGLSDDFSIFALIPAPTFSKEEGQTVSGFGDFFVQGEYTFINTSTATTQTQATVVGSIFFPTGELEFNKGVSTSVPTHLPFTGNGSMSYFLGGTYSYTTTKWYSFVSAGKLFTTSHDNTKIGSSIVYQAGLGRNIANLTDQILLVLFELDGYAIKRDRLLGVIDPNSGEHSIYFGPVLYYATKRLIFQAGIQAPVYQRLHGIQTKNSYFLSISVAWLFNHDDYDKR